MGKGGLALTPAIMASAMAVSLFTLQAMLQAKNEAAFSIFGSVAYLFFIHFTLPEIESSMREKLRGSFVGSVATAFLGTFTISSIFGIIGALGFGAGVSSVVVTELAASPAATTVKVLLVLNLLFTFPVVGRAAFTTLEREMCKVSGVAQSDDLNGPAVLAMRSAFVALAAFCAVSIPSFGRLLGLVGGVCCSALTIFFPPLMLLRVDSRLRSEGAGGIVGAPYKAALYLTVMFGLGVMGLSVLES